MMNALSPWLLNINQHLNDTGLQPIFEQEASGYTFKACLTGDSCWLVVSWPKGSRIAFRMAYSPNDELEIKKISKKEQQIIFQIDSLMGQYESILQLPNADNSVLRLTTTLKAAAPLLFSSAIE